jgi:hypothetical protein
MLCLKLSNLASGYEELIEGFRVLYLQKYNNRGVTLVQLVKLLSCDCKVTGSSPGNSLLCKNRVAAYNTPNGGTPSRTLRMREL